MDLVMEAISRLGKDLPFTIQRKLFAEQDESKSIVKAVKDAGLRVKTNIEKLVLSWNINAEIPIGELKQVGKYIRSIKDVIAFKYEG